MNARPRPPRRLTRSSPLPPPHPLPPLPPSPSTQPLPALRCLQTGRHEGRDGGAERGRGLAPTAVPAPRRTCAASRVAHADGAAQEAGGLAEVARGHVGDVVVAAELLAGAGGRRAGRRAAHHAVCAARLVHHAGLRPQAHHVRARLCGRRRSGRGPVQPRPRPARSHAHTGFAPKPRPRPRPCEEPRPHRRHPKAPPWQVAPPTTGSTLKSRPKPRPRLAPPSSPASVSPAHTGFILKPHHQALPKAPPPQRSPAHTGSTLKGCPS